MLLNATAPNAIAIINSSRCLVPLFFFSTTIDDSALTDGLAVKFPGSISLLMELYMRDC
jgi:hypothetical protein